jgi:hypothetical protein
MNDHPDTWKPQRIRELELHLTDRDIRLLHNLEQFRLLTSGQLQRLHFGVAPFGTHATPLAAVRATNRVLLRLEKLGVIARVHRRVGGPHHGSSATIWQLAPAGERFLRALRGDPDRRKFQQPGAVFTLHTLAVADVAVQLLEQSRIGHYEVLELEPEPVCWRTFQGGAGVLTLKPDLLVVTADAETESHFFIEVDRGTEHLPAIRRKCDIYQRYYRDGSEERLRGLYPAVVWIVPDEPRRKALHQAIAKDPSLDSDLFTVVTTEDAHSTLAPYGPATPTHSPRKEDHQP